MRKAIVIAVDMFSVTANKGVAALEELNQHLAEGWHIIHSLPMSGTEHPVSLSVVVLEKV